MMKPAKLWQNSLLLKRITVTARQDVLERTITHEKQANKMGGGGEHKK